MVEPSVLLAVTIGALAASQACALWWLWRLMRRSGVVAHQSQTPPQPVQAGLRDAEVGAGHKAAWMTHTGEGHAPDLYLASRQGVDGRFREVYRCRLCAYREVRDAQHNVPMTSLEAHEALAGGPLSLEQVVLEVREEVPVRVTPPAAAVYVPKPPQEEAPPPERRWKVRDRATGQLVDDLPTRSDRVGGGR